MFPIRRNGAADLLKKGVVLENTKGCLYKFTGDELLVKYPGEEWNKTFMLDEIENILAQRFRTYHAFEDGEKVRLKETGEIVTVHHWWYSQNGTPYGAQYNIVENPGTWFSEGELEKVK